jgi:nicotinamide-nucleotide amidase
MNDIVHSDLIRLAIRIGDRLEKLKLSLATAESCTGGWIAQVLTSVPTSSSWFERGFVTYSEQSKIDMLNVDCNAIKQYGAVSKEVAIAMCRGAIVYSNAQVSIAVTGLAGPDKDETSSPPLGTCWFAWSIKNEKIITAVECFPGDRNNINYQAVKNALSGLIKLL